ncbi:hypothetical protein MNBD_GAMMA24-930 [hydrothermal vent metagenome]|uniref:Uncharacterized protein n=1 Tax=hydrothermal vent metagenome TaxID=652676 RepID=A0A3B1B5R7_9ZZZZ
MNKSILEISAYYHDSAASLVIDGEIIAAFLVYLIFERLFMGVQILALGLIGELIIFTRARDLKEYTVDEIVG